MHAPANGAWGKSVRGRLRIETTGATTLIHIAFVAALLALLINILSAFVEPSNDEES